MRHEFVTGFGLLLVYFVALAVGALALRRFVKVPREVFRKTLHLIVLGSVFVLTYAFGTWWVSAAASLVFMALVFPVLALAERLPGYSELLIERKGGEIKMSMVTVFTMFAALTCVCWGWLGEKYLMIASVLAWGLGDAAAALVGKRFGRRHIQGKLVEGRKSVEGTLAMFAVSFVAVLAVLLVHGSAKWYSCVPVAAVTAGVCAAVELYTLGGMDTITCPFAAAATMIALLRMWGA